MYVTGCVVYDIKQLSDTYPESLLLMKRRNRTGMNKISRISQNRKKGIIITLILVAILTVLVIFVCMPMVRFVRDTEQLRAYIAEKGLRAILVFILMNVLQTMTTVVPDAPFEIAAGAIFGVVRGTLLNAVSVTIGSIIAFTLSRLFGERYVSLFFDEDQIRRHNLKHMTVRKTLLVSLIFLIPGMPKDLFTYLLGLSDINPVLFVAIVFFCRLPSIALTVMSGSAIAAREKEQVIFIFAVMIVLLAAGLIGYTLYLKKHKE